MSPIWQGLDAGKYLWRSGGEKCFSLDIPFEGIKEISRHQRRTLRADTRPFRARRKLLVIY